MSDDQRRQAALAEFNALRAEIVARTTSQGTLITLVVTAIGLVAGFVIKDEGDVRLLLILPFLVAAAGIHSSAQDRTIALIGAYIRDRLWPFLAEGGPGAGRGAPLPSWESVVTDSRNPDQHRNRGIYVSSLLLGGIPGILIFGAGSVVPLAVLAGTEDALDSLIYAVVWALGAALTLLYGYLALQAPALNRRIDQTLKEKGGDGPGSQKRTSI